MKTHMQKCSDELFDWFNKWTQSGKVEPEVIIGILESLKIIYLNKGYEITMAKIQAGEK